MTSWLFFLTLAALGAFGQQPKTVTLVGTIERLSGSEIHLRAGTRLVTLYADTSTLVRMDKANVDLSLLKAGNEISVRCREDVPGKLIATEIWAKAVTFRATVTELSLNRLVVSTESGTKAVSYYPETIFATSVKSLTVGQEILVVGLDLGRGNVDATRIAVYNTDLPTR